MVIAGWFYIPSGLDLSNLFLLDLECRSCQFYAPGLRIQLKEAAGYPQIERSKLQLPSFGLSQVAVPRDNWFELTWAVQIGEGVSGESQLLIDGVTVIQATGSTLETQFADHYDSVEAGITANASSNTIAIAMDDVTVSVLK